ncbi:MAG: YceI family protein [Candidatus Sericytochromatia bacterium]
MIFLSINLNSVEAKNFNFKFDNKESKISFIIYTSIHPVETKSEKFKGFINISTKTSNTIESVNGLLEIDTKSIVSNIFLLDSRMHSETLNVKKYPKIRFKVNNIHIMNNRIEIDNTALIKIIGDLTIREITKEVEIPFKIRVSNDKESAILDGSHDLDINDYNIPDPSILIAKVKPIIKLTFKLKTRFITLKQN